MQQCLDELRDEEWVHDFLEGTTSFIYEHFVGASLDGAAGDSHEQPGIREEQRGGPVKDHDVEDYRDVISLIE